MCTCTCDCLLQAIATWTSTNQFLETKVSELEKVREASDQEMDDKSVRLLCVFMPHVHVHCTCIRKIYIHYA